MYLTTHHTKWMRLMQRLSDAGPAPTGEALSQDIEQLRMLEDTLIR